MTDNQLFIERKIMLSDNIRSVIQYISSVIHAGKGLLR